MSKAEALSRITNDLVIAFLPPLARSALIAAGAELRRQPEQSEAGMQVAFARMARSAPGDHLPYLSEFGAALAASPDSFGQYRQSLVDAGWSPEEAANIIAGLRKAAATIDLKPTEKVA